MRDVTGLNTQVSQKNEVASLFSPQRVQRLWFLGSYQRKGRAGSDVQQFIADTNFRTMPAINITGSCGQELQTEKFNAIYKKYSCILKLES
jgi:hypothetical protein